MTKPNSAKTASGGLELASSSFRPLPRVSEIVCYQFARTSIAAVAVVLSTAGVVTIAIREKPDDAAFLSTLERRFPDAKLLHDARATRETVEAVVGFIENPHGNLILPLDIRGTEFQRRVWKAVMNVPFGKTTSFALIAKEVGSPHAVRSVGNACTHNPLEFAILCHRVLRSDGSYSGGSPWGDRRQSLIVEREAGGSRSFA